jgi:DNA-binding transcriptional regulator YhcF (GntR family)
MRLNVDPGEPEPLHIQVAGGIRSSIADGTLGEGDRLPAARELADDVGVNVHTVLRAYRQLTDEGLVEMRPGRGTIVRGGVRLDAEMQRLVAMLLNRARIEGLTRDEILALINEKW